MSNWEKVESHLPRNLAVRETRADGACAAAVITFNIFGNYDSTGIIRELISAVYNSDTCLELLRQHTSLREKFPTLVAFKTQLVHQFNEGNASCPQLLIRAGPVALQFQQYVACIRQITTFMSEYDLYVAAALFCARIDVYTPSVDKAVPVDPPERKICERILTHALKTTHVQLQEPAVPIASFPVAYSPQHYRAVGVGRRGLLSNADKATIPVLLHMSVGVLFLHRWSYGTLIRQRIANSFS